MAALERRGLVGRVLERGAVLARNPAGDPVPDDPRAQALSPRLQQEVVCRLLGGSPWWLWAWSGTERNSPADLEPLCPAAEVEHAAERIAHVLAVPSRTGWTVRGPDATLPDGLDSRPVTDAIQLEFPGVLAWYGRATGSWWALVPLRRGPRLVEALDPSELRER
jgi:hypothetical protein